MRNSAKDSNKGTKWPNVGLVHTKLYRYLPKESINCKPFNRKNVSMVAGTCNVCIFCTSLQWSHNFRLKVFLKSKVTKHKKQLKSSQMSVDAKTEDLASQERISGSPANLSSTSMLSGTVAKSVPSEKAAETVMINALDVV